jgi:hypothetical protein
MRALPFLPVLFTCAHASLAQMGVPLTIADGNISFTEGAYTASITAARSSDLRVVPGGADQLFAAGFYYLVAGDARAVAMNAEATATRTATANRIEVRWPDLDARGVISATLVHQVWSSGPMSGNVMSRLTFENISALPQTVSVFHYVDYDLAGTAGADNGFAGMWGPLSSHDVWDFGAAPIGCEYRAEGNTSSDIGPYGGNLGLGTAAGIVALAGRLPPFGPGDYTGAMGWDGLVIPPGEFRTFTVFLCANDWPPSLPSVGHYGTDEGGGPGDPRIDVDTPLMADDVNFLPRPSNILLTDAEPFAPALLASGDMPTWVAFAPGVLVHVVPIVVQSLATDGAGNGAIPIVMPPNPALAGATLFHQYFVLDAASVSGLVSHTCGLRTTAGTL